MVEVKGVSGITITNLTIQNGPTQWGAGLWIENSNGVTATYLTLRNNHSFGLKVLNSQNVKARYLDIYGNDTGTDNSGNLSGFELTDSKIHDHSTMVVDGSGGARGANATNFYHSTGPILVARNLIWNNRAKSITYGYDGGAFEVYGSTGITYTANTIWDNQNVMELGTDGPANSVTFTRNVAYKPAISTAAVPGPSGGILVRACQTCLFANNSISNLDSWSFLVVTSNFTAGVVNSGVRFANNIVQQSSGKAVSADSWTGISCDHDLYWLTGGSVGYTLSSTEKQGNPLWDSQYRIQSGSPAINAGAVISGVSSTYNGTAPDMGYWEY